MRRGPPRREGRAEKCELGVQKRPHPTPAAQLPATATITPSRSIGEAAAEIVADLAFCNRVRRLQARGPRVIAELLAELSAERMMLTDIEGRIERYLSLDDHALDLLGARELGPPPLHVVRR